MTRVLLGILVAPCDTSFKTFRTSSARDKGLSELQRTKFPAPSGRVTPSPPPSDDELYVETFDPAAELEGDPDEPYIAEHVPIGALEAYYSDALYGSKQESASTDSAPASHHSSGSPSASSGSASDGASDDDL
ncbi:hypothetical protein PIB30_034845, partial [Stylosanthes scabra]|nr:hypothetical protein [Stylosanthes scabra]